MNHISATVMKIEETKLPGRRPHYDNIKNQQGRKNVAVDTETRSTVLPTSTAHTCLTTVNSESAKQTNKSFKTFDSSNGVCTHTHGRPTSIVNSVSHSEPQLPENVIITHSLPPNNWSRIEWNGHWRLTPNQP